MASSSGYGEVRLATMRMRVNQMHVCVNLRPKRMGNFLNPVKPRRPNTIGVTYASF